MSQSHGAARLMLVPCSASHLPAPAPPGIRSRPQLRVIAGGKSKPRTGSTRKVPSVQPAPPAPSTPPVPTKPPPPLTVKAQPEYWQAWLARVAVSSRREKANLVIAIARHIADERRLVLHQMTLEAGGRARRRIMMQYHCTLEWLLEWNLLPEYCHGATDPRVLAKWLDVELIAR